MVIYVFLFISLYFEVFILITYFENRLGIKEDSEKAKRGVKKYPTVTIMVPCWNEELTISKTIHSLLNLDYPKNKLKIIIIDDGSTDNTWEIIQKFKNKEQIEIYHKENGGKYTALNFGLTKVTSELVGCLDADSYVDKDALKNIVTYFQDKKTMAVIPSIKIWQPKTIVQLIQKVEYIWNIFIKKILSYIGAIYVAHGAFSIFRKEVFENLGGYRFAHQTEDMEMALRMQSNHYKIVISHDAYVYTVAPSTVRKLYKQRLRWAYGFIKNSIDYRFLFFKKKYGNLGILILPVASLSIISAVYLVLMILIGFGKAVLKGYTKFQTVGFNFRLPQFNLDWFSINTEFLAIISLMVFIGTLAIILLSRKMSEGKITLGMDLFYFLTLYTFLAPLWLGKALYNAVFSVKTNWR